MTLAAFVNDTPAGNKISGINNPKLPFLAQKIPLVSGDTGSSPLNISEHRSFTLTWPALVTATIMYLRVKITEGAPTQRLQDDAGAEIALDVTVAGQFSSLGLVGYAFVELEFDAAVTVAAELQASQS